MEFNAIISDKINVVLAYRAPNSSPSDTVALIDYLQRQCYSELQSIPLIFLSDFNLSKVDCGFFTLLPGHSPTNSNLLQVVLKMVSLNMFLCLPEVIIFLT